MRFEVIIVARWLFGERDRKQVVRERKEDDEIIISSILILLEIRLMCLDHILVSDLVVS